jgi:polysaccharide biosynthesis protein PslJ
VPLLIVVKLALPGSIATLKEAFFPKGGLVQEQTAFHREADPFLQGGRVRQLGPMLQEAGRTPIFGQGFATRQTGFDNPLRNAPILDNQWLGLLLELGIVGVVGWAALFFGSARRLGRAARRRAGPDGWLAAGLAASIVGFGIAMFTFDGFAFSQATFVFWILISLSGCLLLTETEEAIP